MIPYMYTTPNSFEYNTLVTEHLFDFETALNVLMSVAPLKIINRESELSELMAASVEIARKSKTGPARHIATSDPYLNTLPDLLRSHFEVSKERIGGTLMFFQSSDHHNTLLAYEGKYAIHPQARDRCFRIEFR